MEYEDGNEEEVSTREMVEEATGWVLDTEAIADTEYREWYGTLSSVRTFDECVSVGIDLATQASGANFKIGDLANYVVRVDRGEDSGIVSKDMTLKEFSRGIRTDYSRVKEAARVARAVEWGVRVSFPGVMYSHYRAMVRYGMAGPDLVRWAKEVNDKNLSVKALEGAMHEEVKGEGRDGGVRADDWLAKTAEAARHLSEEDVQQCYESRDGVVADDLLAIRQVLALFDSYAAQEPGRESEAKLKASIRRPEGEQQGFADVA